MFDSRVNSSVGKGEREGKERKVKKVSLMMKKKNLEN